MREELSTYQRWTTISRQVRTYVIASLFLTIFLFSGSLELTEMAFGFLILTPLFIYNGLQRTLQLIFLHRRVHVRKINLLFGSLTLLEAVYIALASWIAPHLGQLGYLFPLMLWIAAILQFQAWTNHLVLNFEKVKPLKNPEKGEIEQRYPTGEGIEM